MVGIDEVFQNAFLRRVSIIQPLLMLRLPGSRFAPIRSVEGGFANFFLMSRPLPSYVSYVQQGSGAPIHS